MTLREPLVRRRIGLVACSSTKLDRPAEAQDLYTSPLFQKSRAYVEATCEDWAILSAEHYVIKPWRTITPYDRRLADFTPAGRELWAHKVDYRLRALFGWFPNQVTLVVLAGERYLAFAERYWSPDDIETPLAGMQIGERLAWLNQTLGAAA